MVDNEIFPAALHFIVQVGNGAGMEYRIFEVTAFKVGKRIELMTDFIRPAGTHGNLNALACLQHQMTQGAIKAVQLPYLLEGYARFELVGIAGSREGKTIGR